MDGSYGDLSVTNPMTEDEGTFTEEERELIGREAAKLKREFEAERNKRRGTPHHNTSSRHQSHVNTSLGRTSMYGDPLAEETERSLVTLRDLDKQLQESVHKKQQSLKELGSVQDALRKNKNELRKAERELQETTRKFDHDRDEVLTLEQKKDYLKKDLHEIEDKLADAKRLYNNTLEMNTNEILGIIEERDTLKRKLNESTLGYIERLEFERQLGLCKEELFSEQRSSRMRIDALQEELEQALRKVDDAEEANSELHDKLSSVEKDSKGKQVASSELADMFRHEIKELKHQIEDLKNAERKLYVDLHDRDNSIQELQHLLVEKEKEISYEHEQRAKAIAEKNHEIQSLKDAGERALIAANERGECDKTVALRQNDDKHDEARLELLRKQEMKIADIEADHIRQLELKDQEIMYYQEKFRQQEEATRELGERLRLEAQEQVRSAITREKALWEEEHQRVMKRERNNWEDELNRTQARLNEAIEYEKGQTSSAQKTISSLRKEIDEIRSQNKELHREATDAMMTCREAVQAEHTEQMNTLRHQLTDERDMEVSRLQRDVAEIQDESGRLRAELEAASNSIRAMESAYEHHEKTIVLEVNDECKKVAHIIGIKPRKVNLERYDKKARSLSPGKSIQRTPITDSLANLRACVSELVPHVHGLRETIDSLKMKLQHVKTEKEHELKALKDHFEIEKEKDVESEREKVARSHRQELQDMQEALSKETELEASLRQSLREKELEIRELKSGMTRWKEDTASKVAKEVECSLERRFRDDYQHSKEEFLNQQKLIIRMEDQISRLKAEQALGHPGSSDGNSVKLLRHLQDRVRQLKHENMKMKSHDESFRY